ncbi:hypothetical protein Tco_0730931 [Tanacetum coccineum]
MARVQILEVSRVQGSDIGADDEGFIEVKNKKSGSNNGGTKNFTVPVKSKTQYHPKAKQSTNEMSNSSKTTPFVALNDENHIIEEVATGSKATTSGTQKEGQSSTPIVDKNNVFEKQILEGKLVLVDDDGKPLENGDYLDNLANDDEVEPLVEQRRESNVDDDYDPYDDDMYEGHEIPNNIQTICDNLDIKVRGRKKK